MNQYAVTSTRNVTFCYEATDMRMALAVHHQLHGQGPDAEPVRVEWVGGAE